MDRLLQHGFANAYRVELHQVNVSNVAAMQRRLQGRKLATSRDDAAVTGRISALRLDRRSLASLAEPRRLGSGNIIVHYELHTGGQAPEAVAAVDAQTIEEGMRIAFQGSGLQLIVVCMESDAKAESCDDVSSTSSVQLREVSATLKQKNIIPVIVGISGLCTLLLIVYLIIRSIVRKRAHTLAATQQNNDDPLLFPSGAKERSPAGQDEGPSVGGVQADSCGEAICSREDKSKSSRGSSSNSCTDESDEEDCDSDETNSTSKRPGLGGVPFACRDDASPATSMRIDSTSSAFNGSLFHSSESLETMYSRHGGRSCVSFADRSSPDNLRLDVDTRLVDSEEKEQNKVHDIRRDVLEGWIKKVYSRYNPQKLDRIVDLLSEYEGKEEQLVQAITQKYRLHPTHFPRHFQRSSPSCGACDAGLDHCSGRGGPLNESIEGWSLQRDPV